MPYKNTTLCFKWFQEVWNNGRESAISELLADQTTIHGISDADGAEVKGLQSFKKFYNGFRNDFSNIHVDVQEVLTQEDFESAHCTVTAKHTKSGNEVKFGGIVMVRIDGGKIVESWNHFDFLTMYKQIGYDLVDKNPVQV